MRGKRAQTRRVRGKRARVPRLGSQAALALVGSSGLDRLVRDGWHRRSPTGSGRGSGPVLWVWRQLTRGRTRSADLVPRCRHGGLGTSIEAGPGGVPAPTGAQVLAPATAPVSVPGIDVPMVEHAGQAVAAHRSAVPPGLLGPPGPGRGGRLLRDGRGRRRVGPSGDARPGSGGLSVVPLRQRLPRIRADSPQPGGN